VHTTETEVELGKNPSSSRKVIWPMGIGNQVPSAIGDGKPTVGYPNPPYTRGTVVAPIEAAIGPKFPYPCAGLPIPRSWQEVS
jgi:hypothetical protein